MPHFFIKKEEIKENLITPKDPDTLHHIINVRRSKKGENIKFIDEDKIVYRAKIISLDKKSLSAQILECEKSNRFLTHDIRLIQSVLMPEGQTLAISNAVQTGVKEIYPIVSDNTSAKIKNKEKWQKIAREAFKQCERADFCKIHDVSNLKDTLSIFKHENILIFSEKDHNITLDCVIENLDNKEPIAVVIGPEGGFSDREFEYFKKQKYKLLTLGNLILKAPNAITSAITNIVSRIEK